jgi:acyl phosphate:glycerol-3-phosphate acyltransferase
VPVWMWPAVVLLFGYLLGSIPFGLILTRMFGAGDLRQIGSGNIGATNVLRTGRKVAVCVAREFGDGFGLLGGGAAFLGHCYPIWLRFKGGKGVATMLGVSLALMWQVGLAYALVWLAGLALTRISSVSGMAAALSAPIAAIVFGVPEMALMLGVLAIVVIGKHRENIARIIAGTEPRVGQKSA